ncbi:MAG: bifunctional pyr operon transcriptional regulator/uracil phosphoribosyltransferase PyrR [Deltaproteobacteria bacterium]|nr:bifunctional pyr operon transcriptional regulator/uracil phosphoribosyltransferase PyrR [Deltaproteobacteria bacterium]
MRELREVADETAVARMLKRIAHEITERNDGVDRLALVGIRTGGYHLALRLKTLISEIEDAPVPVGAVDITLYRDDVFQGLPRPEIGTTELPFELRGTTVVLIDDVLFTGRTVRAALDALMDYGRPKMVQLAVLIDRGHRELPIRPDYVGRTIETTLEESVRVNLQENAGQDRVVVRTRKRR